MDPVLSSYEEIPYESTPIHHAHPDVMATSAFLLGLDPPPVPTSRMLELGCSTGGNLITIALSFPEATFVGIDLSPRQIAEGRAIVEKLGLNNVSLHAKSILDIEQDFGRFDYIICHGVYSWVPEEVRKKILSICSHNLSPAGLAYISYNTYPGWHVRGMMREMLNYHVRNTADPRQRIVEGRAFIDLLAKTVRDPDGPYGKLLAREADIVRASPDWYLYHEHFEQDNRPLYFHEFARQCAAAQLDFVAEVRLGNHAPPLLSAAIREALSELPSDLVEREQYLDFLQNRTFRRSILSHQGTAARIAPSPQRVAQLHAECNVRPVPEAKQGDVEQFATREGQKLSTNNPWMKALLHVLFDVWPRSLSYGELREQVDARLDGPTPGERLMQTLMQCYLASLVELMQYPSRFVLEPSQRPRAFPIARLQAVDGLDRVSTLRHRTVILGDFDRLILAMLDGTRTQEQLVEEAMSAIKRGEFSVQKKDQPVTDLHEARQIIADSLPIVLQRLGRAALLVE
ncbi:MAG TPA: class I SAM-dependent methyltransferase [Tepidisphaeraceae bacterium]|jgi:methyltransferase-like protein|nr:class I SAM-dependent methyltransferase [Tepidisphaeraceae bacterium]